MAGVGYCSAVALAAMFFIAGFGKLGKPHVSAEGFEKLGLPAPKFLAFAVPVTEIVVACLLLVIPWVGGVIAFGLLTLFTLVMLHAIRNGIRTPCGCFGSNTTEPEVSWFEVARNVILMVGAFTTLFASEPVRPTMGAVGIVVLGVLACFALTITHGAVNRQRDPSRSVL